MTQLTKKEVIANQESANPIVMEMDQDDGDDYLVLRGSMFRDLLFGVKVVLGSGGNFALEGAGAVVGANYAEYLLEHGNRLEDAPRILGLLLNQTGWGKAHVEVDSASKTGIIRIEDCITAKYIKTSTPNCSFLKGYFKGIIGKLANTEIECQETACMVKGDIACEFHLRKKQL